jgi:hypothetical protein
MVFFNLTNNLILNLYIVFLAMPVEKYTYNYYFQVFQLIFLNFFFNIKNFVLDFFLDHNKFVKLTYYFDLLFRDDKNYYFEIKKLRN